VGIQIDQIHKVDLIMPTSSINSCNLVIY